MFSQFYKKTYLVIFVALFCICFCGESIKTISDNDVKLKSANRSFYHWKTQFNWKVEELELAKKLELKHLYLRLFDVGWNDQTKAAVPIAPIKFISPIPDDINSSPCVYITQKSFTKQDKISIDSLASRILKMRDQLNEGYSEKFGKKLNWNQLQLDCDWAPSNKDSYFYLLKKIRELDPNLTISSTIRLHQIKYRNKTGIPPVDRGMLMVYNTGSVNDFECKNSIIDLSLTKDYLTELATYPLPLDFALPVFSWGRVFKNQNFEGLINAVLVKDLEESACCTKSAANHSYTVNNTSYIHNKLVKKGRAIILDFPSAEVLQETCSFLKKSSPSDSITLAFFHYEPNQISSYPSDFLPSLYQSIISDTSITNNY